MRENSARKDTIERVMHKAEHGPLKTSPGKPVTSRNQAVAITLHETGAAHQESPAKTQKNLAQTKKRATKSKQ
jgi:hypothetical protein